MADSMPTTSVPPRAVKSELPDHVRRRFENEQDLEDTVQRLDGIINALEYFTMHSEALSHAKGLAVVNPPEAVLHRDRDTMVTLINLADRELTEYRARWEDRHAIEIGAA